MKRTLLSIGIIISLITSTPTQADTFTPTPTRLDRAITAAKRYWHKPIPCKLTAGFTNGKTLNRLSGSQYTAAVVYIDDCHILFHREYRRQYHELCMLTIHEVGHLHGYEHSLNPNSIMASAPYIIPRICKKQRIVKKRKQDLTFSR